MQKKQRVLDARKALQMKDTRKGQDLARRVLAGRDSGIDAEFQKNVLELYDELLKTIKKSSYDTIGYAMTDGVTNGLIAANLYREHTKEFGQIMSSLYHARDVIYHAKTT